MPPPCCDKRMCQLVIALVVQFSTQTMASRLFPPNLSRCLANLPLAEDIEKNPTVLSSCCTARCQCISSRKVMSNLLLGTKNYAPLAGLVIPRRRRPQDPDVLVKADVSLLDDMRHIVLEVCQREQRKAFAANGYRLRFHRRPRHSVDHLHLNILAPASEASAWTAFIFLAGSPWILDADALLEKLRRSGD